MFIAGYVGCLVLISFVPGVADSLVVGWGEWTILSRQARSVEITAANITLGNARFLIIA